MQIAMRHARHVDALADDAVALFDRFVRRVDGGGADPERIAETFRELMPAVTTLVALHFQRTVAAARPGAPARAAGHRPRWRRRVAVIESGRLEVAWR